MANDANPEATQLARELFEARRQLRRAGRALHDDTGSLLSSAGLRLQLLRMDLPQAGEAVGETLGLLDQALERVRVMSQELNSSPPAHLGLQNALAQLVASVAQSFPGTVRYSFTASAAIPPDAAVAVYEAMAAVLAGAAAAKGSKSIVISVRGDRNLVARVAVAGWNWPRSSAAAQTRRAAPAGILIRVATKKSTIVSICYALRRPPRG